MIAIVTGATGDIGEEFVKSLLAETDQVWAVGRSENKLSSLKEKYGDKIVPVRVDLSDRDDIFSFCEKIESEKPEIRYLVNNAGVAKMKPVSEFSLEEISDMLDINDKAATLICRACIPYMAKVSYILNVASASAFQPSISANSDSSSAARIPSSSVCPGWVDTKMLPKQRDGKDIRYPGMTPASKVVEVALKDCHKGKDVSVCSFYFRYMRFLSKVTPHSIAMKMWVKAIRQYI